MANVVLDEIKKRYHAAHHRFFKMVEGLTDAQLTWRPTPQPHTITFQIWHMARLDDYFQSRIPSLAPELARKLGPGQRHLESRGTGRQVGA
jgi:hypothetical protein